MEIPLKKVTVAQVIKKKYIGLKTQIKGIDFIGTKCFFIKSNIAPKEFTNRVNTLSEIREMKGKQFEYLTDSNYYKCTDDNVDFTITENKLVIILKTKVGYLGINYNYYSYFKKLGVKLYFSTRMSPIGMFRGNDFVGIIMPVRIKEEK